MSGPEHLQICVRLSDKPGLIKSGTPDQILQFTIVKHVSVMNHGSLGAGGSAVDHDGSGFPVSETGENGRLVQEDRRSLMYKRSEEVIREAGRNGYKRTYKRREGTVRLIAPGDKRR